MERVKLEELTADELLALAEEDTSAIRWDRARIFRTAFDKYQQCGAVERLDDLRREVLVWDLSTHNYPPVRFAAQMSGTTEAGQPWEYPNVQHDFPAESIEYYKRRAEATSNPILTARYSDVVWELARDARYARLAIRAYLDCCPFYAANGWENELADALDRALALATIMNDRSLTEACVAKHYEHLRNSASQDKYRYTLEIIESLLRPERRTVSLLDWNLLIATIEDAITHYTETMPDSFHLRRAFLKLLADGCKIRKDDAEVLKARIQVAESYVEEAEWKRSNYPGGNMVAAHFFEEALQAYAGLGSFVEKFPELKLALQQKIDGLKVKVQQANEAAVETEFQSVSVQVEIPTAPIERYLDMYREQPTATAIFTMLTADPNLVPSYQRAQAFALEQSKEFRLQDLFSTKIIRGTIAVKSLIEPEEKREHHAIEHFMQGYYLTANLFLDRIFAILEEKHTDYLDELIAFLERSEVIDAERVELLRHGVRLFGEKEYVAAMHILTFQIEGILRDMLAGLGLPTFVYKNDAMREKPLFDILTALSQSRGIDQDLLKLIEIFLAHIMGDNFRNDVAHGLLKAGAFTRNRALLLLLILIRLAPYGIVKHEASTQGDSTLEGP